jgi:hypothetical protein
MPVPSNEGMGKVLVANWLDMLPRQLYSHTRAIIRTWILMISPRAPESMTFFTAWLYGEYRSTGSQDLEAW